MYARRRQCLQRFFVFKVKGTKCNRHYRPLCCDLSILVFSSLLPSSSMTIGSSFERAEKVIFRTLLSLESSSKPHFLFLTLLLGSTNRALYTGIRAGSIAMNDYYHLLNRKSYKLG